MGHAAEEGRQRPGRRRDPRDARIERLEEDKARFERWRSGPASGRRPSSPRTVRREAASVPAGAPERGTGKQGRRKPTRVDETRAAPVPTIARRRADAEQDGVLPDTYLSKKLNCCIGATLLNLRYALDMRAHASR